MDFTTFLSLVITLPLSMCCLIPLCMCFCCAQTAGTVLGAPARLLARVRGREVMYPTTAGDGSHKPNEKDYDVVGIEIAPPAVGISHPSALSSSPPLYGEDEVQFQAVYEQTVRG